MSSEVRLDDGSGREVPLDYEDSAYGVLSNPRRRVVCSLLFRCDRLGVGDLVSHIVARETGRPLEDVSVGTIANVRIDLHHRHLPKLEESGLLTWDREAERVAVTGDLPVDRDRLASRLQAGPGSRPDRLLELLTNSRRRTVLSVLAGCGETSTEDLARAVLADERGIPADAVPESDLEVVMTGLRHSHLPALDDAGVLEYDTETGRAAYRGHPLLAR